MTLKERIQNDVKDAMKSQDKSRLITLRMISAAIKQREVDERISLDDTQILATLDKMVKQRRESIEQFQQGQRFDLVEKEKAELELILSYLPQPLSDEAIQSIIKEAIARLQIKDVKDMGKLMAEIKPKLQGRADLAKVSQQIKQLLS